jgi:hypothetical protein
MIMLSISALTPSAAFTAERYTLNPVGRDDVVIDDPYLDKVSLSGGEQQQALTYQHLAKNNKAAAGSEDNGSHTKENEEPAAETDRLAKMMQQVLDGKLGIDRKKLEEIEQKIEALTNKEGELTEADKAQLELLQKQKEQLMKEGTKKLTEEQI